MKNKLTFLFAALALLVAPLSRADITATVYPGYTLVEGEEITVEKLNLLARPTISVFGTLGGTNVAIGAKTISGSHLADNVVDDLTIQFDGSSPRALSVKYDNITLGVVSSHLAVKANGISAGHLDADIIDDLTLEAAPATNDMVWIGDASDSGNSKRTSINQFAATVAASAPLRAVVTAYVTNFVVTNVFTTATYTFDNTAALLVNTNHGMGLTPTVNWVLRCETTDINYAVGDEVSVYAVAQFSDVTVPMFSGGGNATNIFLVKSTSGNGIFLPNKTTGASTQITNSRWRVRGYARP